MKNYLITIFNTPESEKHWQTMTPDQMQAALSKYMEYSQKLRDEGRLVAAEGLSMNGSTLKLVNGKVEVTDGPYVLAKELVGGFYYITANSLAEATEIAKECPGVLHGGTVEVREQMDYGD
ncbi:MAG: YciI family protein [Fimbriimonadaceae bacterium]